LAYSLLDYGFENRDGEVSGEVEDLLIDLNDGRILFATLEYGGFLDLGDREIAVPLSAFSWGAENELILNFDEAALENFPDVGDDWPDFADPAWDDEVSGFWNNIGINPGVDITEASNTVVWAEDLLGYPLVDLGSGVGTIYNMIVDPATSRVRYVLVDFGTGAQADDPYIIPFSALNVESFDPATVGETGLAFDTEISAESLLTTPRFDRTLFLDTALVPAELLAEVDTYWSDQGYEVAGESE
jgi:sporulation protein YlmC with PRC-barrel domain